MTDGKTTPSPAPLPRVRTYARDLEAERERRGQGTTEGVPATASPVASETATQPTVTVAAKAPPPLPPSNERTSAPLPAATPRHLTDLGNISTKPSLSESVAAVISTNQKSEPLPPPTIPAPEPPRPLAPVSIAPFHELARTNQPATVSDFGATIITDTQSRRFKLFPNIFSSLSRWWKARAKERAVARAPKYVIPETDRRKGVIQRATSQTAKVTTGDYEGLRKRLRERVEDTVAAPPEPETYSDPDETFWTPHIEPIFQLLEAPQYTPSSVQSVTLTPRRKIARDISNEDNSPTDREGDNRWEEAARAYAMPKPVEAAPYIPPTPTPVAVAPEPVPTPAAVQNSQPVPKPQPLPSPVEVEDEDAPLPAPPRPAPSTNPKQRPKPTPARRQFFLHTNTITISLVGVVVLGSLVVYLTPRIMERIQTPTTTPTIPQSSTLAAPVVTRSLSIPSRDGLMTALNIAEEDRTLPAVEVVLTGNSTPTSLLSIVDPSLPASFTQNVSRLSFGWYDRSEPFIIMTISDRTSVWGSLLQNEDRLPKILSPFFSPTSSGGRFVDRVVGGHDVRTLVDSTKNEVVSYGLIDDHTLIITTTTETFLSVETLVTTVR